MENDLRVYLRQVQKAIREDNFKPTYIVTAVRLPTNSIELAVNSDSISAKVNYILHAYDDDLRLRTNNRIVMENIMVV